MNKFHLVSAVTFTFAAAGQAQQTATPTYVPAETPVAIVPVINATSVTWQDLKDKQTDRANTFLADDFRRHGFTLVDPNKIAAAIHNLKLNLSDEEVWKRETLRQIGNAVGAKLVLFVVIEETSQHKSPNFFTTTAEGKADLKLWFLDTDEKIDPIFSAKKYQGSSKHSEVVFGTVKGSGLQVIAVANGLNDALKDFFRPYPSQPEKK